MQGRVRVLLTPMGDRIKYQVVGRVHCTRPGQGELPNSGTYDRDDLVWRSVFGSARAVARFLKAGKRTSKIISLYDLGYEDCDRLMSAERRSRKTTGA